MIAISTKRQEASRGYPYSEIKCEFGGGARLNWSDFRLYLMYESTVWRVLWCMALIKIIGVFYDRCERGIQLTVPAIDVDNWENDLQGNIAGRA